MTKNKNNKTKTTKHTIEFSNNTPGVSARAVKPAAISRVLVVRTVVTLRSPETFPGDAVALSGRTASQRLHKVTSGAHSSQIPWATNEFDLRHTGPVGPALSSNTFDAGDIPLPTA